MPTLPPLGALPTLVPPADREGRRDVIHHARDGQALRDLLLGDDSFATVLFLWATDRWGPEWLTDWEFGTLHLELASEWGIDASDLPSGPSDRLLAAREIVTNNRFLNSVPSFVSLTNVFSGDAPDADVRTISVTEAAWAATESQILHPPESWGADVVALVGTLLDEEDYPLVPRALRPIVGDRRNPRGGDAANTKSDEVDRTIVGLLDDLARDVKALPLRTGNSESVLRAIDASRRRIGGR